MTDFQAIEKDINHRMENALSVLSENFRKIRTGRAHSSLVEDIKVPYYGNPAPIKQMANINTPDARTISIVPYDKSHIADIAKALQDVDISLNPNTTSDAVIINIPLLNEETRNNFRKHARNEAEQARIAIRNVRRDAIHKVKENLASEDLEKQQIQQVDNITDKFINSVDELLKQKEEELMNI